MMGLPGAVIGALVCYVVLAFSRLFDVRRSISIGFGGWRFFANSTIVILQAILVSMDFARGLVSFLALAGFCMVNIPSMKAVLRKKGEDE